MINRLPIVEHVALTDEEYAAYWVDAEEHADEVDKPVPEDIACPYAESLYALLESINIRQDYAPIVCKCGDCRDSVEQHIQEYIDNNEDITTQTIDMRLVKRKVMLKDGVCYSTWAYKVGEDLSSSEDVISEKYIVVDVVDTDIVQVALQTLTFADYMRTPKSRRTGIYRWLSLYIKYRVEPELFKDQWESSKSEGVMNGL